MRMNKTHSMLATTLLTLLFSATASAKGRYAKVVAVEPVYRYVSISTPHEICTTEQRLRGHRSSGQALAGAVIGGTVGHVIASNSRNRRAATIAGVVIGSVIGHELGNSKHTRHSGRHQQVNCVSHYQRSKKVKQLEGYDVSYRFRGQHFQTFMHEHPGKKVYVASAPHNKQYSHYAYQQSKHSSRGAFHY